MHRKTLRKTLADNVIALRGDRVQDDVAKAAKRAGHDIDQTTVSRVEREKHPIGIDTIEALAKGLGVPPWRLLHPDLDVAKKGKIVEMDDDLIRLAETLHGFRADRRVDRHVILEFILRLANPPAGGNRST